MYFELLQCLPAFLELVKKVEWLTVNPRHLGLSKGSRIGHSSSPHDKTTPHPWKKDKGSNQERDQYAQVCILYVYFITENATMFLITRFIDDFQLNL